MSIKFGPTFWFDLTAKEYTINIGGKCAFVFIAGSKFWVLGIPFLRDFYHIHDYAGKR